MDILELVDKDINDETLADIGEAIGRSKEAVRKKVLELIGVCEATNATKEALEIWEKLGLPSPLDMDTDFPLLDKSFIPSDIFQDVIRNRKLKLKPGEKVLFRSYDEVYRFGCYNMSHHKWLSKVCTVAAVYGKSFWITEDNGDYPTQFHLDLVKLNYQILNINE